MGNWNAVGVGMRRRRARHARRGALGLGLALFLIAAGARAGEETTPPPAAAPAMPAAVADVETRAEEIFPFDLGERLTLFRRFQGLGTWQVQTVSISSRTLPGSRTHRLYLATAEIRNGGARQCFPRVRMMLYATGRYAGSLYMPSQADPYSEIEPRATRRFVGSVALPLSVRPDAFRIDAVSEVSAYTSREGLPADEAEKAQQPTWMMRVDRQQDALCLTRVPRGFLFQTGSGQRYVRLLTGETFAEGSVPAGQLDPEALKKARGRNSTAPAPSAAP